MLPHPALTRTGNQVLWAEIKRREENRARVADGVVGLLGPEDHYLGGLTDSEFEQVVEDFTEKYDLSQTWVEGLRLQFLWAAEKVGSMRRYKLERERAKERLVFKQLTEMSEDESDYSWLSSPTPKSKGQ